MTYVCTHVEALVLIDLHCHILPGIDDGALNMDDSLKMALQADADGVGVVCATPHVRHDHDVVVHELPARTAQLNAELRERGLRVRVEQGAEVAETAFEGLDEDELRLASLGGTGRWVLLEPAPGPLSDSLTHAVERLRERGALSVIAHPERHAAEDLEDRLRALVERGALVQVTAALLEDEGAAPALLDLFDRGLVHLLGSDAHSSHGGRPVALSGALAKLARSPRMSPHLDWVAHEAPAAILRGEEVEPPF